MSTLYEVSSVQELDTTLAALPNTALAVLSFHAPWAAPCAQMRSLLTALASTYPAPTAGAPTHIIFLSIDAEALPDAAEPYDVSAVPYLVLRKGQKTVDTVSGVDAAKVKAAMEAWVPPEAANPGAAGKPASTLPPQLDVTPRQLEPGAGVPKDSTFRPDTTMSDAGPTAGPVKDLAGYAPDANDPKTAPASTSAYVNGKDTSEEEMNKRLAELVKAAPVMLFMKGTPSAPQCGFSRQLVSILRENGVRYGFFNILADEDVRQALKKWADWPTYPQLWASGELVGGLDIVKEEVESNPDFFKEYTSAKPPTSTEAAPTPA